MHTSSRYLVSASLLALAMAEAAHAQAPEARGGMIEEVVVTARRTEENLQTTPVAVTAATGEALLKAQVNTVDQLQNVAPGLIIQPATAQPGSASFALRGQSSPDGLIAIDQAVGSYLDGVYIARSSGGLFNFVDVERVEVLRGPQGTLFGRNTTGGAINIVTKRPTGRFEGMVRARYGNYDARELTGVVNVPLAGEQIAFRGVFQHTQHDGYGRNLVTGASVGSDNTEFFRASLLLAPENLPLRLLIAGDYTDRSTGGELIGLKSFTATPQNTALVALCSGPNANAACPYRGPAGDSLARYAIDSVGKDNFYNVYSNVRDLYGNAKTRGISATFEYDLTDDIMFKSISAWRAIETDSLSDNDGTPYVFTGGQVLADGNFIDQNQFSEEVQLGGTSLSDRLTWIVGAFYFSEDGFDTAKSYSLFPLSAALNYNDAYVKNKSYAVYGQFTYSITDAIRFTGGLRQTKDKRRITRFNRTETPGNGGVFRCSMEAATLDPGVFCNATNRKTYDYLSYTAGFDWQAAEGVFLYIKTSRANRSGGFNTRAITGGPAVGFEPEKVTDYEAGAKLDLFDRRVRLNTAAFYTDYKNVQRNVPVVVPGSNTLTSGNQNAATAEIKGLETELTVAPTRGLQLSAALTLLDPKYKRFTIPTATNPALDVSATPFIYTPKVSYTLSADYTLPVGVGDLNLHADYAHRSASYGVGPLVGPGLPGLLKQRTNRIPPYGILNGQITLSLQDDRIELAVYGRNITKTKYFQRLLALEDTALGTTSYLPGDPRTYGVSATFKF
jgi:iron complex outermembrane receptor protein